jgi:hypothetical protein
MLAIAAPVSLAGAATVSGRGSAEASGALTSAVRRGERPRLDRPIEEAVGGGGSILSGCSRTSGLTRGLRSERCAERTRRFAIFADDLCDDPFLTETSSRCHRGKIRLPVWLQRSAQIV